MLQIERLKLLRIKLNQNQSTVAENLNMTREAYSMYENGRRQPSNETLAALSRYYHVSADYLIGNCDISDSFADFSPKELFIIRSFPSLDDITIEFIISVIKVRHPETIPLPDNKSIRVKNPGHKRVL